MDEQASLSKVYVPSDDIVAREIEGEIVIVPLVSGIGDLEDELYTLNDSARAIWERLDGSHTLNQIATELGQEFEASGGEIDTDVCGLVNELLRRRIVVAVGPA